MPADGPLTDVRVGDEVPEDDQFFVLDVKTGGRRRLSDGADHVADFDWSPDGGRVALTRQPGARETDEPQSNSCFGLTGRRRVGVPRCLFSAYPGMTQVGLVENRRVCGG